MRRVLIPLLVSLALAAGAPAALAQADVNARVDGAKADASALLKAKTDRAVARAGAEYRTAVEAASAKGVDAKATVGAANDEQSKIHGWLARCKANARAPADVERCLAAVASHMDRQTERIEAAKARLAGADGAGARLKARAEVQLERMNATATWVKAWAERCSGAVETSVVSNADEAAAAREAKAVAERCAEELRAFAAEKAAAEAERREAVREAVAAYRAERTAATDQYKAALAPLKEQWASAKRDAFEACREALGNDAVPSEVRSCMEEKLEASRAEIRVAMDQARMESRARVEQAKTDILAALAVYAPQASPLAGEVAQEVSFE